jgi:hypothetical protein
MTADVRTIGPPRHQINHNGLDRPNETPIEIVELSAFIERLYAWRPDTAAIPHVIDAFTTRVHWSFTKLLGFAF